ncbi:hypothetical protein SIN8267_02649 [Sinobacterium norvegicum]|uniref:Tetratricopeptide repeat protein n=1 Tax=Sinobacterium norvegicum TaxID=1641715 RepID=A0ABM9AHN4_9GAMM|nr:hypothetical protein [Sinobacterium norvegicum]CAH0992517.1 hypothetical protein SIN8267_02649 [Sinobacterium norvegicum]
MKLPSGNPMKPLMLLLISVFFLSVNAVANPVLVAYSEAEIEQQRQQLAYGEVLFHYYSQDYFSALIGQSYLRHQSNRLALSADGRVLEGGMLLSYGVADEAYTIFDQLLATNQPELTANRAWYYLAKLQYHKSNNTAALQSLSNVSGNIPADLHPQYHYLASLLNISGLHLTAAEGFLQGALKDTPYYPYLVFNIAIAKLRQGDTAAAARGLHEVAAIAGISVETAVLADRARHGLAQIAIGNKNYAEAWFQLQDIRTTGLYSNRGLLSYAWAAIKLKDFNQAVAALMALDNRSIAIAEVQEAKVLLGHLYEQQKAPRMALKHYLLAEKEFKHGVNLVNQAKAIIAKQDVPREFVTNLEAIMDESDWYGSQPTVDYSKLTPFLIDLMASNAFQETLRELADLYAIQKNLNYWHGQKQQHLLVVNNRDSIKAYNRVREVRDSSRNVSEQLAEQFAEFNLYTLVLEPEQKKRFTALQQSTGKQLVLLNSRINQLEQLKKPYVQLPENKVLVTDTHRRISQLQQRTDGYIRRLEPVMRQLVDAELDKHLDRMSYYWAQARLAKARLYDTTLMTLDQAKQGQQAVDS